MSDVVNEATIYQSIRDFYEDEWLPQRKFSIIVIRQLAQKIQSLDRKYRIGNVVYACLGLIGGGLCIGGLAAGPLTFGASLILTLAGTIVSLISVFATLTHTCVNVGLTKQYCSDVKIVLNEDVRKTNRLIELIESDEFRNVQATNLITNWNLLKEHFLSLKDPFAVGWKIKGIVEVSAAINIFRAGEFVDDAAALVGIGKAIGPPIEGIGVAPRALTPLGIFGGFAAAIGMVVNLVVLVYNVRKIVSKDVCDHTRKLLEEVNRLTTEVEDFDREVRRLLFNNGEIQEM